MLAFDQDLTPWQGKLAVLGLYDGERTTVHILYVDAKRGELIADVLDSNRSYPGSDHRAFRVPIGNIVSVQPAPASINVRRPTPPPDPCRIPKESSPIRVAILVILFLTMAPISAILFVLFILSGSTIGIQFISLIAYTAAVTLYTFSSNRGGNQPFLFDCPVVRRQFPRLIRRHVMYLAILVTFQSVAFQLRPHLSAWWTTASGRNGSPFVITMSILCGGLAVVQVLNNRSILSRAHLEFAPVDGSNR